MSGKLVYLLLYSLVTLVRASSVLDKYIKNPSSVFHGRYTRDIHKPDFLVPRHVTEEGKFSTYQLPKYYNHREMNERGKRSSDHEAQTVHLMLPFNGIDHHVELTPYHEFISPHMVIETRGPGIEKSLNEGLRFARASDDQCHYRGHVRGHPNSRAALSLCDGVAGYVQTNDGRFFIEPVDDSQPESDGQHVHVAYSREIPHEIDGSIAGSGKPFCGTSSNWEAAWAEQLGKRQQMLLDKEETQPVNNSASIGPSKRARPPQSSGTHSIHRYIEVGVVCDRRFLDFHKNTDYEKYVMTVMNMVADFWSDESCGNQIDIVVVRIIYLEMEKKEIDLNISPQGEKTLDSFAAWAQKLNPKDPKHPNHFDVAALLTRYDICSEQTSCDLTGLAFVAAACDPTNAASINEDMGLILGIVVAHEIGHIMGCAHDSVDETGCPYQNPKDESYYLMSPIVSLHTNKWSTCSRKLITAYLESGLGDCLNNNPRNPPEKYRFPHILPGVMYDVNAQCNFVQPGSKYCNMGQQSACEMLVCRNGTNCYSKGDPPADGTKCGEKKWCINKKCVDMGSRPSAVHGGWGKWGKLSECSRSCGLGVRIAERECNKPMPSNGGRYCIGERKRYETCNPTPCNPKKPGFRAIQCAEFNKKPVGSDQKMHKWIPYLADDLEPCSLYCINEKNTFIKLQPVVKDATPCKGGTNDMCISGGCRKVGCDLVIDSPALEDKCGVCQGDGTSCSPVSGVFKKTGLSGYQDIVTVPKGARSISVSEKNDCENILAIKPVSSKKHCLNGGNTEERNGDYECAGSLIIYSHPQTNKEEISIKGPLTEPIQIQYVFFNRGQNPGVSWKYYVHSNTAKSTVPKYAWDFTEWSECSAKCGGGTAIAEASCVEETSGLVSPNFCLNIPRPEPQSRICNEEPCPAKWRVSQWSKCNACDGKQGLRHRKVQCIKPAPHPGGDDIIAEFEACHGRVPKQEESCVGERPCKKVCPKKSRDCPHEEVALPDPKERERFLNEQRRTIDNLVDLGLARYLEKTRHESANEIASKSFKRDITADFKSLLKDWVLLGSDNKNKRTCNKNPNQKTAYGTPEGQQQPVATDAAAHAPANPAPDPNHKMVTLKPGSIVKDAKPPGDAVLYEVPILNTYLEGNMSDIAFQQGGDVVPIGVDSDKGKVYHGLEAVKMLHAKPANQTSQRTNVDDVANRDSSEGEKHTGEPRAYYTAPNSLKTSNSTNQLQNKMVGTN